MDLKELGAFVQVAAHGSFTRAAEVLGTDQPALSRLVRRLEIELRQTLLVRNGRGAVPTDAGEVLLVHAKEILQHVEGAQLAMKGLHGVPRHRFRLGIVPHVARFATLSLVRDVRARFPGATVTVAEGVSTSLLEALLTGRIDAAVMYDPPRSGLIDKRTLFREALFLIGPERKRSQPPTSIRFQELGHYPLVISSRLHAIRDAVEAQAARHGVELDIALEVDAVSSVLELVQEGYGHAVLPLDALKRDESKRRFAATPIVEPSLHCRLVVATNRQHPLSAFARTALGLLEADILQLHAEQARAAQD